MTTKSKYNLGQKVIVYGFVGTIADTTEAPEEYGVTFDAHGNTFAVPGDIITTDNRPITERVKTLEDAIAIR